MSKLFELKNDIFNIFNKIKGYCAGYTSNCPNKLLIDKDDERFLIEITKIENPSDNMIDDIRIYMRGR